MHRFATSTLKSHHDNDMNYSTRYDDREIIHGKKLIEKLNWLEEKLNNEITLCSHCLLKLERLADRYWVDGIAAGKDNDIAYRLRYTEAYEHVQILIHAGYAKLPKVI